MQKDEIKALISAGIPDCQVEVMGDDGTHFEAVIVSDAFKRMNMVQRHQLVYQSLGGKMGGEIHALSMQTYTMEEWQQKSQLRVI